VPGYRPAPDLEGSSPIARRRAVRAILIDDPLICLFAAGRAEIDSVPFAQEAERVKIVRALLGDRRYGAVAPTGPYLAGMESPLLTPDGR